MSRLQGLVSHPVPILWIVFCNTGGMRYAVSSTRQYHILVASHETILHQLQFAMSLPMCIGNAGVIVIVGPCSSDHL